MSIYSDVWPQVRLEDLVIDMQPGFAQSPNDANTGTPQLRTNNVSPTGGLDLTDLIRVKLPVRNQENCLLQPGDIIFNNTNSVEWVGKTAYFAQSEAFTFSNHLTRIRVDESRIDAQFLARYLHYLWQVGFSRSRSHQWVNQAAIDQLTLALFNIPLPPLLEQQQIVEILRQAEEVRELRKRAEEKSRKIYQSLFKYHFGSGMPTEKYPATIKLKELLKVPLTSGYSPSEVDDTNLGTAVFTLSAITDYGLDETQVKYTSEKNLIGKGDDLEKDDILISRSNTNELVGRVARYKGVPFPVIYPDLMIRIRLKNPKDSAYVENVLRSEAMTALIQRKARGTSGSMKKISQGDIDDFDILWPSEEARQTFTKQLELVDRQLEVFTAAAKDLDTLLQSLLAHAFSGQLTEKWRERHRGELQAIGPGLRIDLEREREKRRQGRQLAWIAAGEPRTALRTELSEGQEAILQALSNSHRYMTAQMITDDVSLPLHVVRESLRLLRDTGLIQEVELPGRAGWREMTYITAFRRILASDVVLTDDIKLLREEMSL